MSFDSRVPSVPGSNIAFFVASKISKNGIFNDIEGGKHQIISSSEKHDFIDSNF